MTDYILPRETVETLMDALILRLEEAMFDFGRLPDEEVADAANHILDMDDAFWDVRGGHWLNPEQLAEVRRLAWPIA